MSWKRALAILFAALAWPVAASAQLPPAGGIVINQLPIQGGTSGRLLYDNGGKVGEALLRYSAANFFLGSTDAAAPVAQNISVQNVVAGTTDTAGANLTFFGSQGTGTGNGGSISFRVAQPAASTSSTQNATAAALIISGVNGNVSIHTAASTNSSLRVSKPIIGATSSYGILSDGTVASTVTTAASGLRVISNTAAAAFTLTSYSAVRAEQGTIGAGSSVTNQYGFFADSTLTGATNNYGFYSDIASTANRFNFYGNGTAASLFKGDLTVFGATAIPAGGTAGSGYKFSSATNFGIFFGSGAPSLAAAKGSLYLRSDGTGIADRAYINTDGNTAWTNLVTGG